MGLQHLACQQSLCALTIVNVAPRIAIEAPGVDLAHIWTNAQPLAQAAQPDSDSAPSCDIRNCHHIRCSDASRCIPL